MGSDEYESTWTYCDFTYLTREGAPAQFDVPYCIAHVQAGACVSPCPRGIASWMAAHRQAGEMVRANHYVPLYRTAGSAPPQLAACVNMQVDCGGGPKVQSTFFEKPRRGSSEALAGGAQRPAVAWGTPQAAEFTSRGVNPSGKLRHLSRMECKVLFSMEPIPRAPASPLPAGEKERREGMRRAADIEANTAEAGDDGLGSSDSDESGSSDGGSSGEVGLRGVFGDVLHC